MIYKYAIDFGTTYSSIALRYVDAAGKERTEICELDDDQKTVTSLPTVVYVEGDNPERPKKLLVGQEAKNAKANHGSGHIFRKFKVNLAKGDAVAEAEDDGTKYPISVLASGVLKKLKEAADRAAKECNIRPRGVVMGVPVGFPDPAKTVLRDALCKAGFYVDMQDAQEGTEFVPEPVAVAVAYGKKVEDGQKRVLVFDFGGGTLDVAILDLSDAGKEKDRRLPHTVLGKRGKSLGGETLTQLLLAEIFAPEYRDSIAKYAELLGIPKWADLESSEVWKRMADKSDGLGLQDELDSLKCRLSRNKKWAQEIRTHNCFFAQHEYYQQDYTEAIENAGLLEEIQNLVEDCLNSAGLDHDDIDEVLMAGGSSLIPCVQDILKQELKFEDKLRGCNNENIVARDVLNSVITGLSMYACREDEGIRLVEDRVEHDYGVWDVKKKQVSVILPQDTAYTDMRYNKTMASGGCFKEYEVVGVQSASAPVLIEIYEQDGSEKYKLGAINLNRKGSGNYRIFMSVDEKTGCLVVDIYDRSWGKWYDNIPLGDRTFDISDHTDEDFDDLYF